MNRRKYALEVGTDVVSIAQRRLAGGHSGREIARESGVSVMTVLRIRRGEHVTNRLGPRHVRCGGCGGSVRRGRECILCRERAIRAGTQKRRAA